MRFRKQIIVVTLLLLSGACSAGEARTSAPAGGPVRYGPARRLAMLANSRISESSGIAASRLRDGVFWTHNDSDDAARLYALDREGRDLGTFDVTGARARDWEDIASFTRNGRSWLLIGDVGNNNRDQKSAVLYLVPEPEVAPDRPSGRTEPAVAIRFAYPDGPQDCEAIAVDPAAGKIYLAAKALLPLCKVYDLDLPESPPDAILTARHVATVTVSLATGMDISPDGRRMVICNYFEAAECIRHAAESWADALNRLPRRLALPNRRQGEAICYGPDGRSLYLTSERRPTPLLEVPALDGE